MHAWKRKARIKAWLDFVLGSRYVYRRYKLIYCNDKCEYCRYFVNLLCVRLGMPEQFQYCKYIKDRHLTKRRNKCTKDCSTQ